VDKPFHSSLKNKLEMCGFKNDFHTLKLKHTTSL